MAINDLVRLVGRARETFTDRSAIRDEAQVEDVLLGPESIGNTHKDHLVPGPHHPRGGRLQ